MGASGDRGLAALWCLGLLGGLARVAGTHYRYLWRGCYPCHLGQAGYPVSAGDQRPVCARALPARLEEAGWGGVRQARLPLGQGRWTLRSQTPPHPRPLSGLLAQAANSREVS
ncbi:hypothetical protein P7K49_015238 [Saguinus oedipus]|uniref:Uncharacterized protein n=1 Tax=Saguinus oedipus TaxID=9490 RepID=A0ABQ9V8N0_SAGOE|nr:hypothetical protein P7K49_015238 [Saguinus oedipus]